MLKKKLTIVLLIFSLAQIYAKLEIYLVYKGNEYFVSPISKEVFKIEPFNALSEIDQTQAYRLLLTGIEKSRLSSLSYVGDKFEYNNIELGLIDNDKYLITDILDGLRIIFSVGIYDNIIIESALNFNDKEFNIEDKVATAYSVRYLFNKMLNKIRVENNIAVDNKAHEDAKVAEEYDKFIAELKLLKPDDAFNYITKYAELNFTINPKSNIIGDWTSPASLYFYKQGDYKSTAFFYYYSLKQAGFNVRSYLVTELLKKNEEDIEYIYKLFNKKFKPGENLKKIQELELEYKRVNGNVNILNFFDNYLDPKFKKPPMLFFYYPPKFEASVFLVAAKINEKWMYTTGDKWIDPDIKNNPERACAHYARNGCYYGYMEKDFALLNNYPLDEKEFIWDVFYDIKL